MFLIFLLLLAAFSVSGSAAFFSVTGLAHTFPFAFYSVVILGTSLEVAKLITASFVYRYWKKITWVFKSVSVFLIITLMALTSIGIFGYLNAAYQSGSIDSKDISQKVEILNQQKIYYEKRLAFIDNQIEKSPEKYVKRKIELIKTLQSEKQKIIQDLDGVNKERNELLTKQINSEAKIGPIVFVAKAFNLPVDNAIGYLIALIMVVFDPLAVYLTIAANIVIKDRELTKNTTKPINDTVIVDSPWNYEKVTISNTEAEKSEETKVYNESYELLNSKLDDVLNKINSPITPILDKKKELLNSIRNI